MFPDIHRDGYEASLDGYASSDNPHPRGTLAAATWQEGWDLVGGNLKGQGLDEEWSPELYYRKASPQGTSPQGTSATA